MKDNPTVALLPASPKKTAESPEKALQCVRLKGAPQAFCLMMIVRKGTIQTMIQGICDSLKD